MLMNAQMKKIQKYILLFLLTTLPVVGMQAVSLDEIPNVHVADRTKFVSDPDGYLSAEALAKADSIIASVWNASTAELVAVIVGNLDGNDIDMSATELFEKWGLGKKDKDNGVLLLVAMDDREAVIRTGYGVEGVLPDVVCSRILRQIMFPRFQAGDYDGGVVNALGAMCDIMTTPDAADELMSKYANDATAGGEDHFFRNYLIIGIVAFVTMLVILLLSYRNSSSMERHERYEKLRRLKLPYLVLTVGFIGIPVLSYLLLLYLMKRVRRQQPRCHNCDHHMRLIDEVHDNDYLTPAQDVEEQLNSIDYDVWHCDNCGANEIIPFVNHRVGFLICPNCNARAAVLESNNIVRQPTEHSEGAGRKVFVCRNCGQRREELYKIAKIMAPPVFLGGLGGGRGNGGGFGGFGGGGFGGGHTGGGGASGGW